MNQYNKEKTVENPSHSIRLIDRKELEINGVKEIDSFDSEEFLIETVMGYLVVRGFNLQLKNLNVDTGLIQITGKISDVIYVDDNHQESAKGLFSKLFK